MLSLNLKKNTSFIVRKLECRHFLSLANWKLDTLSFFNSLCMGNYLENVLYISQHRSFLFPFSLEQIIYFFVFGPNWLVWKLVISFAVSCGWFGWFCLLKKDNSVLCYNRMSAISGTYVSSSSTSRSPLAHGFLSLPVQGR